MAFLTVFFGKPNSYWPSVGCFDNLIQCHISFSLTFTLTLTLFHTRTHTHTHTNTHTHTHSHSKHTHSRTHKHARTYTDKYTHTYKHTVCRMSDFDSKENIVYNYLRPFQCILMTKNSISSSSDFR